jgi:hypothetical protein
MVIDRLMRDPYGYAFNSARNLGYGLAIRDAFTEDIAVADFRTITPEREFLAEFGKCHTYTGNETDLVPCRDVATWAAHNGIRLQNSQKMLELVRQKYTNIYTKSKRIPKRHGTLGTETRDCFFKLKRVMWRDDGVAPPSLSDANSSFGTEPDESKDEVASELSFEA